MKGKKTYSVLLLLLVALFLAACGKKAEFAESKKVHTIDKSHILNIAWQYVVNQIEEKEVYRNVADARITRIEELESYSDGNSQIETFALEFSVIYSRDSGWTPAGYSDGATYLSFRYDDASSPQLIAVQSTREILAAGSLQANAAEIAQNVPIDYSKKGTDSKEFSAEEIENAFLSIENWESVNSCILINLWYDEERYQDDLESFKGNTLYGMDELAKAGDLLILYGDIYSTDEINAQLLREYRFVLGRSNDEWEIKTTGY